MNTHYRLKLQRPISGLTTCQPLAELYREQRRIDPLLEQRKLPPIRHFLDPLDRTDSGGKPHDGWFEAESGRRLVHTIVGLIHREAVIPDNRCRLLAELFDLSERLEAAMLTGNRWQLVLELEFA